MGVGWRCELKGDYGEEDRLVNCGKPVCLYFNNDIRVISDLHTSVKPHLKKQTSELTLRRPRPL